MVLVFQLGCQSSKMKQTNPTMDTMFTPQYTTGPRALVYKTKRDYNKLVPISLAADRNQITSYPHPKDLKVGENFLTPTLLEGGYLLDNKGIGVTVAFLELTYQKYAQLQNPLSLRELNNHILDKDPLIELCDCGNKTAFTAIKEQLNQLIKNNQLRTVCKVIK